MRTSAVHGLLVGSLTISGRKRSDGGSDLPDERAMVPPVLEGETKANRAAREGAQDAKRLVAGDRRGDGVGVGARVLGEREREGHRHARHGRPHERPAENRSHAPLAVGARRPVVPQLTGND